MGHVVNFDPFLENEDVSEMGCTAVEIILFGNEPIKFNENLDQCDEKIQKDFG